MNSDNEGCIFGSIIAFCIALCTIPFFFIGCSGCSSTPKPVTEEVKTLDKLQGKWVVMQVVGPDGKAFEGDNMVMDIKDNVAFQGDTQLRLEFNADATSLKLYAKTDTGEKLVGEVTVTITIAEPIQMLWADKGNPTQETLFEKVTPE